MRRITDEEAWRTSVHGNGCNPAKSNTIRRPGEKCEMTQKMLQPHPLLAASYVTSCGVAAAAMAVALLALTHRLRTAGWRDVDVASAGVAAA